MFVTRTSFPIAIVFAACAAAPVLAASTDIQPTAALQWGPPNAGLVLSLRSEGDVAVGGSLRLVVSIKSAAGNAVTLPPAREFFGWVLVAQSTPGSKKALYSERLFFARDSKDWPAQVKGDVAFSCPALDLAGRKAYASEDTKALLLAYISGKPDTDLPKPAGKMTELLSPGPARVKVTLCLPVAGARPETVSSNSVEIIVGPPDWKTLSADAQQAFIADLLRQFDRDPWSGQQAHDAAVRLKADVLAPILAAAFETARPSHARLWLATTVADIRDDRSVDALIKLLDDSVSGVRAVVAYHGPKQTSPRLDKAILDKALASKDSSLLAWTLLGFLVHRGSVPEEVLKAGLESDDPRVRATVAEALSQHASEFNIARLVRLLEDPNERVRGAAAAVLGKSGVRSRAVLGALVKALDLPGETARARLCAALSELAGRNQPYDPKADPAAHNKTIADWKAWWAEAAKGSVPAGSTPSGSLPP